MEGLRGRGVNVGLGAAVVDVLSTSVGRMPDANAAASDAGRLATRDEIIFLRNL